MLLPWAARRLARRADDPLRDARVDGATRRIFALVIFTVGAPNATALAMIAPGAGAVAAARGVATVDHAGGGR